MRTFILCFPPVWIHKFGGTVTFSIGLRNIDVIVMIIGYIVFVYIYYYFRFVLLFSLCYCLRF